MVISRVRGGRAVACRLACALALAGGLARAEVPAAVSGAESETVSGGEIAAVSGAESAAVSGGESAAVSGGESAAVSGGESAAVSSGDSAAMPDEPAAASGARAAEGQGRAGVTGFEPNYLLIGADSFGEDVPGETEAARAARRGGGDCDLRFQLSFSRRLSVPRGLSGGAVGRTFGRDSPLFFGFTQRAWWDICRDSAPFRETNYAPSLFYRGSVPMLGGESDLLAGYLHQSNGVDGSRSRSWERLFARVRLPFGESLGTAGFETVDHRRWLVDLSLWYPFATGEETRDIARFAGYGELVLSYTPNAELRFRLSARKGGGLSRWERGLGELDVVFPIPGTDVQGLLQYTNGYGASLERFDRHGYAVRVGFLFSDFALPSR